MTRKQQISCFFFFLTLKYSPFIVKCLRLVDFSYIDLGHHGTLNHPGTNLLLRYPNDTILQVHGSSAVDHWGTLARATNKKISCPPPHTHIFVQNIHVAFDFYLIIYKRFVKFRTKCCSLLTKYIFYEEKFYKYIYIMYIKPLIASHFF